MGIYKTNEPFIEKKYVFKTINANTAIDDNIFVTHIFMDTFPGNLLYMTFNSISELIEFNKALITNPLYLPINTNLSTNSTVSFSGYKA